MSLACAVSLSDGVASLGDFKGTQSGQFLVSCSTSEPAGLHNRRECRFWCEGSLQAYSQRPRKAVFVPTMLPSDYWAHP
ncbi:hypothetical protein IW262DRAFT_1464377 [Armillaria fumosa]|nr:hypothetical protein IW262DRAFT_1464377 [Armillaria fumosa]